MQDTIQVIWLKRDLRLRDNLLIAEAARYDEPTLFIYIDTSSREGDRLYNQPRQDFIANCLANVNDQLKICGHTFLTFKGAYRDCFQLLAAQFDIKRIITSQQTDGLKEFALEVELSGYLKSTPTHIIEIGKDGIVRKLPNRDKWADHIDRYLKVKTIDTKSLLSNIVAFTKSHVLTSRFEYPKLVHQEPQYQPGGESFGLKYLNSFLAKRIRHYSTSISKPEAARFHCSRLSPYLAMGAISARTVYQAITEYELHTNDDFNSKNFLSRMRWRSHFIQKFESETEMEYIPYNRAFAKYEIVSNYDVLLQFKLGQTGIPLADACLRCLMHTGYLNFRMRAMLISVGVFILRLHWRDVGDHLATYFLDYEPGIHYPQVHMQSGLTGTNVIRIYNPHKQLLDHDSDCAYTKKWVPELRGLSTEVVSNIGIETEADIHAQTAQYKPFSNLEYHLKQAQAYFWAIQKDPDVVAEAKRIVGKHSTATRWA